MDISYRYNNVPLEDVDLREESGLGRPRFGPLRFDFGFKTHGYGRGRQGTGFTGARIWVSKARI